MNTFSVKSVNISEGRGVPKRPTESIFCKKDHGIVDDGHAGPGLRQVSLLAFEDVQSMCAENKGVKLDYGDFAENITTEGVDLSKLPLGARLAIGDVELEITQIGKECHSSCIVRQRTGKCIMPDRGVFAKVVKEGEIRRGDTGTYGV